jgi:PD-(D/E)XK endonuclease
MAHDRSLSGDKFMTKPKVKVKIKHPKRRGEWAEMRFMAKAAENGLEVAKPYGEMSRYDFAVEYEGKFVRVQVKSTMASHGRGYECTVRGWRGPYGRKQRMTGKVLLYFGEPTLKQADTFFDSFDKSKMVGGGSEIILPPGIPPDLKKSPAFTTSRSDVIAQDSATLDGIDKTDGSFAIVGIVTYYDSLGTFYRTDYCLMHTANGVLAWCARHNEIH